MVKTIAVAVAAAFVGVASVSWAQTSASGSTGSSAGSSTSSSAPSSTTSPNSTTSPGSTTQPGSTLPSTTLPGTSPSTSIGGSTSSSAGASAPLPSQCVGLVGLERERCIQRNGSATGAAG